MNEIGVIGLSTMGKNIALNLADHQFKVAVYNRTYTNTKDLLELSHINIKGYEQLEDFVKSISRPRKIMFLIKSGNPIDELIEKIVHHLDEGDILMDGGNSFFEDTGRREKKLKEKNIYYYGVGISGGENGARFGASLMPAGDATIYPLIAPYLEAIAAKKDDDYCVRYIGESGAGHYVKMVHNGIEYADMQLLAEVYLLLKAQQYSNIQIGQLFSDWNKGPLESYLLKISSIIVTERDPYNNAFLVDKISDAAANKGTGKWTSVEAIKLDVDASLISASYYARVFSNKKNDYGTIPKSMKRLELNEIKKAYYLAKIVAFIQGFNLLKEASDRYDFKLKLKDIAHIFKAGCIIQCELLDVIEAALEENSELIESPLIRKLIITHKSELKIVDSSAVLAEVPIVAMSCATSYINQLCARQLGANLIQGQRDYFGAHGFERVDQEGAFHHDWTKR